MATVREKHAIVGYDVSDIVTFYKAWHAGRLSFPWNTCKRGERELGYPSCPR